MTDIRLVLADDDEGMRLILSKMIEKAGGFQLAAQASSGPELMALVEKEHPQVVFLDVEMPGMSGVECAKMIQDMDPSIILIFATGHDDYMADAFEVYAFDYLVKPFKVERVLATLERVKLRLNDRDEKPLPVTHRPSGAATGRMMLHHKDGVSFLGMKDILLIQRENRATVLYTADGGRYETAESLSETEAKLDPEVFFRCHKSYIINLNAVKNILPYGRWTYVVQLDGIKQDALITHEKYEELEKKFS